MSFDAGSAVSTLGLDMNPFAQGMLQAQGIAQLFPSVVTNFLADPLLGFASLAKDVAGSVFSAFQTIGHAADNAGEAAEKAGVSASFLTTVGQAAADAGSSAEGLGDSLKFLNKNAAEAASGNQDVLKSFTDLGLSVTDAQGAMKSTEQLFYEVTDAIAALPNAALKTSSAMGLLGRGGSDMIAFMDQGSPKIRAMAEQIEALGGGIDDSLASAGDKFGTLGTLFDAALTGIKRAVAEPILKALQDHFDDVVGFIQAGSGVVRTVIGTVVSGVASAVQTIGPLVGGLGGQVGNALLAFLPMVGSLVEVLTSLATIVGPVLAGALAVLVPALQLVGDLLSWIFGLVSRLLGGIAHAEHFRHRAAAEPQVRRRLTVTTRQSCNVVTFRPYTDASATTLDGTTRLALKLESDWVVSAGLAPNVNTAIVPYREFDKLGENLDRPGLVEFWESDPAVEGAEPAVSIDLQRLVDVEAVTVGQPRDVSVATRVVEYRLYFADFRADFVEPRGGRLVLGDVNPQPARIDPATKKAEDPKTNGDLIEACLNAMGVAWSVDETRIKALSSVPPMMDLKWYGSHAPTELAKLLTYVGAVAVPQSAGVLSIEMIGDGEEPEIPGERAITPINLGKLDRRGKTVIFTSAPTPAFRTFAPEASSALPKFRFVVQDEQGKWQSLHEVFGTLDPLKELRKGFKDHPPAQRERFLAQLYRCIQPDPDDETPAGRILRQTLALDQSLLPAEVQAKTAIPTVDRLYKNPTDFTTIPIDHLDAPNGVIHLRHRLLALPQAMAVTALPEAAGNPIDPAKDIRLRLTLEALSEDGKQFEYFVCGFTKDLGNTVNDLSEDDAKSAMTSGGPDVIVISLPQLHYVKETGSGGVKDNRQDLVDQQCKPLAKRYLAGSGQEFVIRPAVGFVAGELSGKVAEIRYSQTALTTTFKVNNWWRPAEALRPQPGKGDAS